MQTQLDVEETGDGEPEFNDFPPLPTDWILNSADVTGGVLAIAGDGPGDGARSDQDAEPDPDDVAADHAESAGDLRDDDADAEADDDAADERLSVLLEKAAAELGLREEQVPSRPAVPVAVDSRPDAVEQVGVQDRPRSAEEPVASNAADSAVSVAVELARAQLRRRWGAGADDRRYPGVAAPVVVDPETPDPETPDPETPDPETPDPETPDPETPDPETPGAGSAGERELEAVWGSWRRQRRDGAVDRNRDELTPPLMDRATESIAEVLASYGEMLGDGPLIAPVAVTESVPDRAGDEAYGDFVDDPRPHPDYAPLAAAGPVESEDVESEDVESEDVESEDVESEITGADPDSPDVDFVQALESAAPPAGADAREHGPDDSQDRHRPHGDVAGRSSQEPLAVPAEPTTEDPAPDAPGLGEDPTSGQDLDSGRELSHSPQPAATVSTAEERGTPTGAVPPAPADQVPAGSAPAGEAPGSTGSPVRTRTWRNVLIVSPAKRAKKLHAHVFSTFAGTTAAVRRVDALLAGYEPGDPSGAVTEYRAELAELISDLPATTMAEIRRSLRDAGLVGAIRSMEEVPAAVGAIAQVHRGEDATGQLAAIKLMHPGVWQTLPTEMARVRAAESGMTRYLPGDLVRQLLLTATTRTVADLNFNNEATLQDQVGSTLVVPHLSVPAVRFSSPILLISSWAVGRPLDAALAVGALDAAARSRAATAIAAFLLAAPSLTGTAHADLHPGNVLVTDSGDVTVLDFGYTVPTPVRLPDALGSLLRAGVRGDLRAGLRAASDAQLAGHGVHRPLELAAAVLALLDQDEWVLSAATGADLRAAAAGSSIAAPAAAVLAATLFGAGLLQRLAAPVAPGELLRTYLPGFHPRS
jgi:hypothetical protein